MFPFTEEISNISAGNAYERSSLTVCNQLHYIITYLYYTYLIIYLLYFQLCRDF